VSRQRRRGQSAFVFSLTTITDGRGNRKLAPDMEHGTAVRAAFIPQRSSRAEVPGQQEVDVVRMLVGADVPDVGLWAIVQWRGDLWDVAAPPAYHHGTRGTRHISVDLRRRPPAPPGGG